VVLLVVLFGVYAFFTVRFFEEQMMKNVLTSANRMSDVIKKSTHYSMLLNRKQDVYQTINTIGTEPGVEGIRIYNKRGEVMFSTDKREEGSAVDMHAEACYACHDQQRPLTSLSANSRVRIYGSSNGHRVLGLIDPIRNEPSCSDAECHAHPSDRTVLGVLDVRMSLQQIDQNIAQAQQTIVAYAVVMIVVVALIAVLFLLGTIVKPVRNLMSGVRQISSGNLDAHIILHARDELGALADGFNDMAASLRREKEENQRWAATLEERIREKTDELKAIHSQILQIEKMASLGKLSATVAHELNNPLEAILTYAKLIARRLKKESSLPEPSRQTLEDIELIARETQRCGTIVQNLLLFSKKQVGEFAVVPIKPIVDKAAQLVQHHFSISNVKLETVYADESVTLMCDENQIQQALVALFVNAVEAMPDGGTIHVNITHSAEDLHILLTDSGVGILPEDIPHIFEPFYTTKKDGKGVGLGLSVVYGIIDRHGGKISVESKAGKGTTFRIILPRVSAHMQPANKSEHLKEERVI